jgi:tRNA(His) 5'-end guanylyltransferase
MKMYEQRDADSRFMPLLPIIARVDGRSFHTFTRGMTRPYDADFSKCMIETTRLMVKETHARMGYTQSDEITLAWYSDDIKSSVWFDGRVSKMTSQLGALATLLFFIQVQKWDAEKGTNYASRLPTFDARAWQVPNLTEGMNAFQWREWDATKNSISMAAASMFSNKQVFKKNGSEMQEMMFQKGVNWNDYPTFFKRGTYVQRKTVSRPFSSAELDKLPAKHAARTNPALEVVRSTIEVLSLPPLGTLTNREDVIFNGASPITFKDNIDRIKNDLVKEVESC